MEVTHTNDLDSHAVLIGNYDFPSCNPPVWKLLLPRAFDDLEVDHQKVESASVPMELQHAVEQALQTDDLTSAFGQWSKHAEESLRQATVEGSHPGRRYLGRACQPVPVKRCLAAPRFKQGRPTDFRAQEPSVALKVRQTQKQGRRLQTLERLMRKATGPCPRAIIQEAHQVWDVIVHATGFGKSFPHWVVTQAQLTWQDFPSISQVLRLKEAVMAYSNKCCSHAWQRKKLLFNEQVERSWSAEGGSLPFRLLKDTHKPPVNDVTIHLPLRLAPQRWSPVGKAWIQVLNPQDFPLGCVLYGDSAEVKIIDKQADSLQFDRLLSRKEASSLFRSFVSAEPEVWTDHFLSHWSTYWNRPTVEDDAIQEVMQAMPNFPQMVFRLCNYRTGNVHCDPHANVLCEGLMVGQFRTCSGSLTNSPAYCFAFSSEPSNRLAVRNSFPLGSWCCSGKRTMHALVGL